jgi:peptide/nickel transport system permease protein/oligopeptide transport system permease protein
VARYLVRRLLQFVPTVLGALFLLHYLTSVAIQLTGNPVRAVFGDRVPPESVLRNLTERLGLGDPCLEQSFNPCFGLFLTRLESIFLHFDFGTDFNQRPVLDIVASALPLTVRLTIIAFTVELIIGIIAGVLAGLRNGSFWDYLVKISTVLLIAVPIFVLAVVVRDFVNVSFGNWLRGMDGVPDLISRGVFAPTWTPNYQWASLVIPGFVLGALSLATIARLTRTSLLENMRADYVRTARAKGLDRRRVVGVHTLRNSLIPVVTFLGTDIGALMGGAVITEGVFSVPGIGRQVFAAIFTGETTVVIGIVTLLVLVYLIASLVVDLLYAVLDPRIRYE